MNQDLNQTHIDAGRRNFIVNQSSSIDNVAGKFVSSWSLIAFGSVSLLLPYVSEGIINGYITKNLLIWRSAVVLFLVSTITSLLWLLIKAIGETVAMNSNIKNPSDRNDSETWLFLRRLKLLKRLVVAIAVTALPSAFICVFIFLVTNGMI